ncbi:MAG: hypothetical protein IT372_38685 [Polyangiaceae bacterium]|nr:hypothetical protein [Polyangiaceae bacterium]
MSAEREALLEAFRPVLVELLRRADRGRLGEDLAAYVVTLAEPTGYLLALAIERRYGRPEPDRVLRRALEAEVPRRPVLFGVMARGGLAGLLDGLSPRFSELGAELLRAEVSHSGGVVLVAAAGGAEVVPLAVEGPLRLAG